LTNLESDDGLDTSSLIEIQVDPGEGKLLKFKEIDENIRSSYKMAYAAYYKEWRELTKKQDYLLLYF